MNRLTEKEYRDELFDILLETKESISTFVFSKNDWETKHSITPFYQRVQQDGIRFRSLSRDNDIKRRLIFLI